MSVVSTLAHCDDTGLPASLANLGAELNLLEDADYPRFTESRFLHVETPLGVDSLLTSGVGIQGDFK